MRSTSRTPVWVSILVGAMAAGLLAVVGCALDKPQNQPRQVFNRIGGHGGQVIEPRRCLLRVAIVDRRFGDPAINDAVWHFADEQAIAPAERKALQANGLRIGRIIGELPRELESILKDEGPHAAKVVPLNILLESGEPTLVSLCPRVAQVSLLVTRDDGASGRDYQDASGFLRLTPRHHGEHAISLRVVPEIHHGPIHRTFQNVPNATGLAPQELSVRNGQTEEAIRELAVDLSLEDGQVAIIGCRPDKMKSLGTFLFSQTAADNDERHQRLVLIWASRNLTGVVAEAPKGGERPRRFRRQATPPDEPPANPAPPEAAPPRIPGPPQPTAPSTRPAAAPAKSAAAPAKAQTPANPPAPAATPGSAQPPENQSVPPLPDPGSSP
jgi:hypothetical protein